jgi:hypothetical protein
MIERRSGRDRRGMKARAKCWLCADKGFITDGFNKPLKPCPDCRKPIIAAIMKSLRGAGQ